MRTHKMRSEKRIRFGKPDYAGHLNNKWQTVPLRISHQNLYVIINFGTVQNISFQHDRHGHEHDI